MLPLAVVANHTEADILEQNEEADNNSIQHDIDRPLKLLVQSPRCPINTESRTQDGEIQRGVVVMDVGDTCHSHERQVVQEPTNDRVDTGIVDVINVVLGQLIVATLPADGVPGHEETEDAEGSGRTPVDEWVTEEEVLHNVVIPAAHAEADVQKWPLPWLGGKVVLLVWVWDQSVVGRHHGDVEVDEVTPEWRLVRAWVSRRNC